MTKQTPIGQIYEDKAMVEALILDTLVAFIERTGLTLEGVDLSFVTAHPLDRPRAISILTSVKLDVRLP